MVKVSRTDQWNDEWQSNKWSPIAPQMMNGRGSRSDWPSFKTNKQTNMLSVLGGSWRTHADMQRTCKLHREVPGGFELKTFLLWGNSTTHWRTVSQLLIPFSKMFFTWEDTSLFHSSIHSFLWSSSCCTIFGLSVWLGWWLWVRQRNHSSLCALHCISCFISWSHLSNSIKHNFIVTL